MLTMVAVQASKPPKVEYNKVRDLTYYTTGSVKTDGRTRYEAYFSFPGKEPARPSLAVIDFLTFHNSRGPDYDGEAAEWSGVKEVTFNVKGEIKTFKTEYSSWIDKDSMRQTLVGRTLVEQVRVEVPLDFLVKLSGEDTLYEIGRTQGSIKGKGRSPLKKLADSVPPAKPLTSG